MKVTAEPCPHYLLLDHTAMEGYNTRSWILMDYNDVIVNLFTAEQRDHYNIEKIWNDCISVDFEPEKEQ